MFNRLFTRPNNVHFRLLIVVGLTGCVTWLMLTLWPFARQRGTNTTASVTSPDGAPRKLGGEMTRAYLDQTSEGQSLMKALEVERFGLKWQEHSPFESPTHLSLSNRGAGYLGMSHDENLNAWFEDEGVIIRPTLSENEGGKAWRLKMNLKAYGYGAELHNAPPIISKNVKDSRIEYARDDSANPQSEIRNPKLVEWYVNKSAGIEQGFTLNERPERDANAESREPLRLVVAVTGDLRARAAADGQAVELSKNDAGVLSYSKLVALDATGRKLAARMETNKGGDEIALIVDDAKAQYPIVIDPITATLEQKLDSSIDSQQDARFGFAVAIDGNRAIIGAWRQDYTSNADAGAVFTFARSGSTWTLEVSYSGLSAGASCGWSVAISGNRVLYGCPGANNGVGRAFLIVLSTRFSELLPPDTTFLGRFGESLAISGDKIVVGAPGSGGTDSGALLFFTVNSDNTVSFSALRADGPSNALEGTSVDIHGDTVVVGRPGVGAGEVDVFSFASKSFLARL